QASVVTSGTPAVNIPDYPPLEAVLARIAQLGRHVIVDSGRLAQEAGAARAQNMVMLGAAARFLIVNEADLKEFIRQIFEPRGEAVVAANLKAFDLGQAAALRA
ncbi:MAG: 2-oxoacid:acceptor oxidoreductase family protein, partial [bacterium]